MGWEKIIKADFGKYRLGLQNAYITPSDRYSTLNGQRQYLYPAHNVSQGAITVQNMGVNIPIEDIQQGEWVNAFGFKLYQNGTYTNKVAMCRFYGSAIINTPNDINRYYHIQWAIFDENTHNYSWLGQYYVEIGIGSIGSVHWKDVKCNLVFQVREETLPDAQGGRQNVIYGGIYCYANDSDYGSQYTFVGLGMCGIGEKWHLSQYDEVKIEGETTSPEFGPASTPGGGYVPGGGAIPGSGGNRKQPSFDNSSDRIEISSKPTLSAIDSGFFNAYVIDPADMQYLSDALFPQPLLNQPDVLSMLGELTQVIFFNKQIDYILDAVILPIDVPASSKVPISCGGHSLGTVIGGETVFIYGAPVVDGYVDFTCGSISIDEYWVNFLDFAGTKVKLFLPYVGYVDIQPEYVIGGTLYVDYRFNVIDGSFMAYVRSYSGYSQLDESLVGQFAGVAAVHIPLQAQDYSNKISGLISAVGAVAAGAASGGIGAAAGAGAATSAANTIIQKPGSSHANGYNASSSFLSNRTPYLIIERQWSQFSEKYPEEVGMPSNVMCRLGDLHGLVKSENAHLDVIPASVEGKERISQLLADGIIL